MRNEWFLLDRNLKEWTSIDWIFNIAYMYIVVRIESFREIHYRAYM